MDKDICISLNDVRNQFMRSAISQYDGAGSGKRDGKVCGNEVPETDKVAFEQYVLDSQTPISLFVCGRTVKLLKSQLDCLIRLASDNPVRFENILDRVTIEEGYVTELGLRRLKITNLSALKGLIKLKKLDLEGSIVKDLRPLGSLKNLEELSLFANRQVRDLDPLKNLTSLKKLDLDCCEQVSDISPLQNLTNLKWLSLRHTRVRDIRPLRNLTMLETLDLDSTPLSDLTPLKGLTNLVFLSVRIEWIGDLSPLSKMTKLEAFYTWGHNISDISPLKNLKKLQKLELHPSSGGLEDISALRHLNNLRELALINASFIKDYTPLKALTNLRSLNLNLCRFSDVNSLAGLVKLKYLDLSYTSLRDVDLNPLKRLTNLKRLRLEVSSAPKKQVQILQTALKDTEISH